MGKSTSAQTEIADIAETTWGTTPAGALSQLRCIGESIEFKKGELVSQEIRSHRQVTTTIHGTHSVEGTIDCEFTNGMDRWLEAAFYSTFATGVLKIGQTLKQFTVERRMIGIGQFQKYTGVRATGISFDLKPEAIAQMKINVMGKTLPTPAADALNGPTGWLVNNVAGYAIGTLTMNIDAGTTNFASGDQFVIYKAATPTEMRSDQIYTASSGSGTSVTFTPGLDVAILDNDILHACKPATVVSSDDPANGFSGTVTEGGSPIAIATSITLDIQQGVEPAKVVGASQIQALVPGAVSVKGTLDLYVENSVLFNKFVTEGYSTLQFVLTSGANTYTFLLPKIKYAGAAMSKQPAGGLMVLAMPFNAVYDGSELTAVKVTKA